MLSDQQYVEESLVDNLYSLRTLRECCANIQLSLPIINENLIKKSKELGLRYEELGRIAISLADGRLPNRFFIRSPFVTRFSLDCELLTEKLFGIDINTELTADELKMKPGNNNAITKDLLNQIHKLNEDAISVTNEFIDFGTDIYDSMKNEDIFSYMYPLFYNYAIGAARIFDSDLLRIQQKHAVDPTYIATYQYRFSTSMKQACQFIIGYSDPNQYSIISNAETFKTLFEERVKSYITTTMTPINQQNLNEDTLRIVNSFIVFLTQLIEDILTKGSYFITAPIFFDNLLTEAHLFSIFLEESKATG